MSQATLTPQSVSAVMARLVPNIMRGAQLDFFVKSGVTQTQFLVLGAISSYPRCALGLLAENLHVSMPTMSGIVERLVKAGYARRRPDEKDRRMVRIDLTAKGQVVIDSFQKLVRQRWQELLEKVTASELEGFHRAIQTILSKIQPGKKAA